MPTPVQISFHGLDTSDALSARIQELADKLGSVYDRIERVEVAVEAPHRNLKRGQRFHVRIRIHVPGPDVIIDRDPGLDEDHVDAYAAVRDAFLAARRRLDDHVARMRETA